ncbi:MAG: PH domain-containing protein [Flavobacterium sp.]|nr:PH domain-containing protein [Flavobacterium sp.]
MKIYRSKIDWWLMLIVYGAFVYPVVDGIRMKQYILSLVFVGIILFISFLFYKTRYTIEGENLLIWRTKIDINSIRKVYKTRNPLSSPALSLDRLAVVYNKFDEVLISPVERDDFIQELLKINPNIEVVH